MKFKEMNLPNKLTTIRMFCVPFMVVLFVLFLLHNNYNVPCDYKVVYSDVTSITVSLSVCQIVMVVLFAFAA